MFSIYYPMFSLYFQFVFFLVSCSYYPCLNPRGKSNISFRHILECGSVYFCKFCTLFHFQLFSILGDFYMIYFSFYSIFKSLSQPNDIYSSGQCETLAHSNNSYQDQCQTWENNGHQNSVQIG